MDQRMPPYSLEAEQAVLGGCMLADWGFEAAGEQVNERDFYRKDHRLIWRALQQLSDVDRPRDPVTVSDVLQRDGQLDDAGGLAYLCMLTSEAGSAANVRAYAAVVRERAVLRGLIQVGTDITDMGFAPNRRSAAELVDAAEQRVMALGEERSRQGEPATMPEVMGRVVEYIERTVAGQTPGVTTGFVDLDRRTTGLHPGDLIIVAGRPSMGKSTFALNVGDNIADTGRAVMMFSMEMPADQLGMRQVASRGRIDLQRIRTGDLDDRHWDRLHKAMMAIERSPVVIDDQGGLSPNQIRSRARAWARRCRRENQPLGALIVDYIQLMQIPGNSENRTNEIAAVSRSLKALAKELGVPVIALSQLNRSVENRDDKRPRMADLRESGGIEQDADLILMLYRDEVYKPDTEFGGIAEVICRKQRQGPLGTDRLAFVGDQVRFENLAENWEPPEPQKPARRTRRAFNAGGKKPGASHD